MFLSRKAVKKGLEEAVPLFKQRVEEYDRLEEQGYVSFCAVRRHIRSA